MPIYKATITSSSDFPQKVRLIEAKNKDAAKNHAAKDHIAVEVADPKEIHLLGRQGIEIEQVE